MKTDPLLLEVLSNKLNAVAEEMGHTLQRAGRTVYVKETADFGTALADRNGRFFAYPKDIGVIGFVGLHCGMTLEAVGSLEPGDIIVTNDPYRSGGLATHTPDLHLIQPYFVDGELVCYGWTFVHSADIGGKVPSSISPTSTDLFQEGFIIPPTKLVRRGRLDERFVEIYKANCRTPVQNMGDVDAMIAALRVGSARVSEAVQRHGLDAILQAQEDLIEYARLGARRALRKIPDGTYEFKDYLDDDFVTRMPVRICVRMTVRDGLVEADFSGSDPQTAGPFNVPTHGGVHPYLTMKFVNFVHTVDPQALINHGTFLNISVKSPRGLIGNPEFPASTGIRFAAALRFSDTVNGALVQAVPDLMPACPSGTVVPLVLVEPVGGAGDMKVLVLQFLVGATGARRGSDGVDGREPGMSSMANNPIEIVESESSVRVVEYGLRADSGGAGRWRGGCGQFFTFMVGVDGCSVLARGMERLSFAPWGASGGHAAGCLRLVKNLGRPEERELYKIDLIGLEAGDTLTVMMPGGGGFGDPMTRPVEAVVADVKRGFVSVGKARHDYGVAIRNGEPDLKETGRLRAAARGDGRDFSFGASRIAWESVVTDAHYREAAKLEADLPAARRRQRRVKHFARLVPGIAQSASENMAPLDVLVKDARKPS